LVFNNADDIDIWTDKVGSITSSGRRINCLLKSKYDSILFTARSRKVAVKLLGRNSDLVGLAAIWRGVAGSGLHGW
jgi:hypothetical protein